MRDRQRGTLLGLAVADALGAPIKFQLPGDFPEITDLRGGGPHGLKPGEWTDNTATALALADSIIHAGWDLNDQARRYVEWWQKGKYTIRGRPLFVGTTTDHSLRRFLEIGDALATADRSEAASGNGSIMRLAPIPIHFVGLFADQLGQLIQKLVESSLPTHASPQCLSACVYLGLVTCGLIRGIDRNQVLAADWPPLVELKKLHPLHPEIEDVVGGSFRRKTATEVVGSGYVVSSLEAALWAFARATDFRQAVLTAVNLGDDADTTGAVCGQLAGACWGESGIPAPWREALLRRDMLDQALEGLIT